MCTYNIHLLNTVKLSKQRKASRFAPSHKNSVTTKIQTGKAGAKSKPDSKQVSKKPSKGLRS
jgi:hypothetical protein